MLILMPLTVVVTEKPVNTQKAEKRRQVFPKAVPVLEMIKEHDFGHHLPSLQACCSMARHGAAERQNRPGPSLLRLPGFVCAFHKMPEWPSR